MHSYDDRGEATGKLGDAAVVEKPPFLNPIVEYQPKDGEDKHFGKDSCIETAIHDALAQQLVLQLQLEIVFFKGRVCLQLREQTVLP